MNASRSPSLYSSLGTSFHLDWMLRVVLSLPREGRWKHPCQINAFLWFNGKKNWVFFSEVCHSAAHLHANRWIFSSGHVCPSQRGRSLSRAASFWILALIKRLCSPPPRIWHSLHVFDLFPRRFSVKLQRYLWGEVPEDQHFLEVSKLHLCSCLCSLFYGPTTKKLVKSCPEWTRTSPTRQSGR